MAELRRVRRRRGGIGTSLQILPRTFQMRGIFNAQCPDLTLYAAYWRLCCNLLRLGLDGSGTFPLQKKQTVYENMFSESSVHPSYAFQLVQILCAIAQSHGSVNVCD